MNKVNLYFKNKRKCLYLIQKLRNTEIFMHKHLETELQLPTLFLRFDYDSRLWNFCKFLFFFSLSRPMVVARNLLLSTGRGGALTTLRVDFWA